MLKSNPFSFSEVYDDHFTMDDVAILHRAARGMRISAGQLMFIAYIQHFREKPSPGKLRSLNNAFVFQDEVPVWAKEFALEIIEQIGEGTFDPWRYGISPRIEAPRGLQIGKGFYGLIPFALWLILYLVYN